ncbi:MAG: hypothetical protein HY691_01870 [Chloroflexi bacterium]|nr:hypothetical protein [Chloroflexota bacterium]
MSDARQDDLAHLLDVLASIDALLGPLLAGAEGEALRWAGTPPAAAPQPPASTAHHRGG